MEMGRGFVAAIVGSVYRYKVMAGFRVGVSGHRVPMRIVHVGIAVGLDGHRITTIAE